MMIGFKKENTSIDKRIIDNIRGLSIDMIDAASSGHPGIALGAAPILTTLYGNHLIVNPKDDKWINRDRFVMSAGHGSSLLYATLYMSGYDITLDDLKDFRKIDSKTPGHPEVNVTPGVDVSTGPLGQGISTAVGIAIGEKYLEKYFGEEIINYNTYVLCGEGDLMEGISYEACSLAGKLGLNKLIVLFDSNGITLDGSLDNSFNENIKMRFESQGWNYLHVADGEQTQDIDSAIEKAKQSDKPTIIEIKTTIGKYSELQGTSDVHGAPLTKEDITNVKNKLSLRDVTFQPTAESLEIMQQSINNRTLEIYDAWQKKYESLDKNTKKDLDSIINYKNPINLKDIIYDLPTEMKEATRQSSGKVLNSISDIYPFLIGGSADVCKSTNAKIKSSSAFSNNYPLGRNINFGIREHAMGAIANGIALTGLTPFASTFFSFSDYLKPAIRMSALMDLPVVYVFTHDSITVGEDGPTHQPVEQLIALRSIPNLDVYRPADANEVIGSYKAIFEKRKPAALVLGRNKVEINELTNINETMKGAYILDKEHKKLDAIIVTTGEELNLTCRIKKELESKGYDIRIVSMPSIEVFERQEKEYKEEILPKQTKTFVIEASSSYSWYKYVNDENYLFTVDNFGYSGKKDDILNKFNLTEEYIIKKIEELLN
ncbi:MAG: transketolase [Bacilli bacterium]|nr:transketolase [Bacilli bacterium]